MLALLPIPPASTPPLAFLFNLGGPELMVILLVGVLIFGSRLPEVGRKVGRTVHQLRQGMAEFQRQIDADDDLGEARRSMSQLGRELKGVKQNAIDATKLVPGSIPRSEVRPDPDAPASDPGSGCQPEVTASAEPSDVEGTNGEVGGTTSNGGGSDLADPEPRG